MYCSVTCVEKLVRVISIVLVLERFGQSAPTQKVTSSLLPSRPKRILSRICPFLGSFEGREKDRGESLGQLEVSRSRARKRGGGRGVRELAEHIYLWYVLPDLV